MIQLIEARNAKAGEIELVRPDREVRDGVTAPAAGIVDKCVRTGPAGQRVIVRTAIDRIIAGGPIDHIVATIAINGVISRCAVECFARVVAVDG